MQNVWPPELAGAWVGPMSACVCSSALYRAGQVWKCSKSVHMRSPGTFAFLMIVKKTTENH